MGFCFSFCFCFLDRQTCFRLGASFHSSFCTMGIFDGLWKQVCYVRLVEKGCKAARYPLRKGCLLIVLFSVVSVNFFTIACYSSLPYSLLLSFRFSIFSFCTASRFSGYSSWVV